VPQKPRRSPASSKLEQKFLGNLLQKNPSILEVLDTHGIHFCAGCFLTLFSPLKKVAAYHAVPDSREFLKDLRKSLARKASSNHD